MSRVIIGLLQVDRKIGRFGSTSRWAAMKLSAGRWPLALDFRVLWNALRNRAGPVTTVLGSDVRCGVGPVAAGVAQVPASARMATAIAEALLADRVGPHTVRQAWLWLAGARLGPATAELAAPIRAGLAGARSGEQGRLLETVLGYAACGSVQQVAARLPCHRNTVVNRLRRFAEPTGCDVTVRTRRCWCRSCWPGTTVASWPYATADDRCDPTAPSADTSTEIAGKVEQSIF